MTEQMIGKQNLCQIQLLQGKTAPKSQSIVTPKNIQPFNFLMLYCESWLHIASTISNLHKLTGVL